MNNLENVTLVSIDSVKDNPNKSNIRLAAISRLVPEICKHINFGDILMINPFNKNKELIEKKFETLWPFDWINSGGIAWYNNFLIKQLPHLIKTDWYLIIQWDGFPRFHNFHFDTEFFNYPYLGGGHSLINGGFSLRNTKIMQDISKINETYNKGSEDAFYSTFFDNEFTQEYATPFKFKWPEENVLNKFCFFEDTKYEPQTFGWHRSYCLSKKKIFEMFNETNIFNSNELDLLVDYSLLKEINGIDFDLNKFEMEYNEQFFEKY
jgi:hypothetical protein